MKGLDLIFCDVIFRHGPIFVVLGSSIVDLIDRIKSY